MIDHIVGGQFFFATQASGAAPGGDAPPSFASGDFLATFDQGSAACVAAFSADGVMDSILHLPFGDMPGSAFVGLAATDTFFHGWDLARATGQSSDLDPGWRPDCSKASARRSITSSADPTGKPRSDLRQQPRRMRRARIDVLRSSAERSKRAEHYIACGSAVNRSQSAAAK